MSFIYNYLWPWYQPPILVPPEEEKKEEKKVSFDIPDLQSNVNREIGNIAAMGYKEWFFLRQKFPSK